MNRNMMGNKWNWGFGTTVYHWFYKGVDALRMNRMNVQNDGKKQTPSEWDGAYTLGGPQGERGNHCSFSISAVDQNPFIPMRFLKSWIPKLGPMTWMMGYPHDLGNHP